MPKAKRSAPSNRQQDEAAPAAKRQPGKKLATLDKNNQGSVDQIPVNEVLFVQDGFPLSFYVELCRDKKSLGELIFKHGGSLSKLITDCSSSGLPPTILASSEKSVREGFALPVFHSSYVQACISADKILSKHTFQIYPPSPPSPS
ncbi:MAG: hypothetical protein Q8P67_08995, partial [archaeon]|nr:hypothetical protein [archaeon]